MGSLRTLRSEYYWIEDFEPEITELDEDLKYIVENAIRQQGYFGWLCSGPSIRMSLYCVYGLRHNYCVEIFEPDFSKSDPNPRYLYVRVATKN